MKVIISNTVTLNGGDAAILHAVVKMVREALGDVEIVVYDSQPEVASKYHRDFTFRKLVYDAARDRILSRLARARVRKAAQMLVEGNVGGARVACPSNIWPSLQEYASADLVASTGGTYLVEHYDIAHRLFDFELCAILGTPLVFFTQSLGPFSDPTNIAQVRAAFGRAPFALLRDTRSRDHLVEIGVPEENLIVCADAVFALTDEQTVEAAKGRELPEVGLRVAVSVRAWTHFEGRTPQEGMDLYRRSVAAIVSELVRDHDAEVVFVSTCQGIPEYWTHDTETADEVYDLLDQDVRAQTTIDRTFHEPLELRDMLGDFDMVLATRMHAAILALIAGTPVLPVAYEFKTRELFDVLGAGELVLDIDTMTPEGSVQTLRAFMETFDTRYRERVFEAVKGEKKRAMRGVEALESLELEEKR